MTTTAPTTAPAGAPRLGGLARSEWLRALSRRSTRWLVGLAALAVVLVSAVIWLNTGPTSQAELDAAAARFIAEQQVYYEQCLADPGIPAADKEMACWSPSAEEARANAIWYLDRAPFTQDDMVGLLSFAGGLATVVCLLLASSAGGADWGARTMGLLLSWEPRRVRVLLVRLAITCAVAAGALVLVLGTALVASSVIAGSHGLEPGTDLPEGASYGTADLGAGVELALRWLPVGVLAAAGSFGLAMITRSTGWAIGASIGFVAVVESVVQGVWAWGSQWLVQTNIIAWLQGGIAWTVDRRALQSATPLGQAAPDALPLGQIWLSQGRALATLTAMVVTCLVVAAVLLSRRDVD